MDHRRARPPSDAAAGCRGADAPETGGDRHGGGPASEVGAVWRPVQYLGSKLRVVDAISALARDAARPGSRVTDLFAGSTVVSQGLARAGFRVTAVDAQCYAHLFARALLGVGRASGETLDADRVLDRAADVRRTAASAWSVHEAREDDARSKADGRGLRALDDGLPLAWRRGRHVADPGAPLTSFYAGSYFGVRQSLDLDAIRLALLGPEGCPPGSWLQAGAMTALMHAASAAVHSAGKHFAQPLKARAANAAFLDRRLVSDRTVGVFDAFRSACAMVDRAAPVGDRGHGALWTEAEIHMAGPKASQALYYLDPPYTAQQYSRFYHLLETIATGATPSMPAGSAPTSGLYPEHRYRSAFSSRRSAPGALARILERVAAEGATAILSYSISAEGSTGNARMMTFDELIAAGRRIFSARRVEVIELEHRYRQFNNVRNANEGRDDREVLVLCRPA